jgi:hypothetical protein
LELLGQAGGPDVSGLGDVGIGVDEPFSALHGGNSLARAGSPAQRVNANRHPSVSMATPSSWMCSEASWHGEANCPVIVMLS